MGKELQFKGLDEERERWNKHSCPPDSPWVFVLPPPPNLSPLIRNKLQVIQEGRVLLWEEEQIRNELRYQI